MKTAIIALVLAVASPAHVRFTLLGCPVSLSVVWLLAAAEVLVTVAAVVLAVRALRRFRSSPYPRLAGSVS
jgi:NADH:ubiquinone oxidoreductase subunit 6 (subunit J)